MENLKARQIEILKALIASGTPIPMESLLAKFSKSERTIQYDLLDLKKKLKEKDIDLKTKSKQGFYIPISEKVDCSKIISLYANKTDQPNLYNRDKLKDEVLVYFALENKVKKIDECANDLAVSVSTVKRVLTKINECDESIKIKKIKEGYQLLGDEEELRVYVSKTIASYLNGETTVDEWYNSLPYLLKKYISKELLEKVSSSIKEVNGKYNVWISNQGYLNILSYCLVQMRRSIGFETLVDSTNKLDESKYADDILNRIHGSNKIMKSEITMLVNVMVRNGIVIPAEKSFYDDIEGTIIRMIEVISKGCEKAKLNFDQAQLKKDLQFHLAHYLKLINYKIPIEDNTLITEIKTKYKLFYTLAERSAKMFEEKYKTDITDTEISYIAIYIYKNIKNENGNRLRVYVVCATGKGLSNLLTTRIRNVFPQIEIVGQSSAYSVANISNKVDFIISTITLPKVKVKVIKISPILTSNDIQKIQNYIHLGSAIDQIPVKQYSDVVQPKFDPFNLKDLEVDANRKDLANMAQIISRVNLTLLDYLSKISENTQINPDTLLGINIHMNMAISRWYEERDDEVDLDVEKGYEMIVNNHPSIYEVMEKFFELVEESLLVTISRKERYAFYLYILTKE